MESCFKRPEDRQGHLCWPLNVIILIIIGIPAFSGYPLGRWSAEVVAGIAWSGVVYWVLVLTVVRWLLGTRMFANIMALSVLVTLPVVFVGGSVSWIGIVTGLSGESSQSVGSHYVALCLTMLTVVPLALAMVALLPFGQFEQRLLFSPQGVSPRQKKMLMVLRVFNHIAFGVLPGTLEILREERLIHSRPPGIGSIGSRRSRCWLLVRQIVNSLIYIAVGTICAALQYIPLWAYEIGQLPESPPKRRLVEKK